jgi:rhodanese-related sulfurtransferase
MGLFDKLRGRKEEPAPPAPSQPPGDDWQEQGTPQEMQPAEVRAALAGPNPPQLLDVREPQELQAKGWIAGSIHIPMRAVPERLGELDKTRPVVVYCAGGVRSFDVGFLLIENGFRDVANLNGGLAAWDGPVERGG